MTAWCPHVKGIEEVFHARFVDHAYPPHTHDAWTLLIVDAGTISYGLCPATNTGRRAGTLRCCLRTCRTTAAR